MKQRPEVRFDEQPEDLVVRLIRAETDAVTSAAIHTYDQFIANAEQQIRKWTREEDGG